MFNVTAYFKEGMRAALPAVPTVFFIFLGFGTSAALAGMPALPAAVMSVLIYAAPAQYAILDMAGSGAAGAWRLALVGILANLRFFVMGLWFAQTFKGVSARALMFFCHFVAATPFLLVYIQSRKKEPGDLFEFYKGVSLTLPIPSLLGVVAGLALGSLLPEPLKFGALLFMPVYFFILLMNELKGWREAMAIAMGAVTTPLLEAQAPGWGLLAGPALTGLAVTAAGRR